MKNNEISCPYCAYTFKLSDAYPYKMDIDHEYLDNSMEMIMINPEGHFSIALDLNCPECGGELRLYLELELDHLELFDDKSDCIFRI